MRDSGHIWVDLNRHTFRKRTYREFVQLTIPIKNRKSILSRGMGLISDLRRSTDTRMNRIQTANTRSTREMCGPPMNMLTKRFWLFLANKRIRGLMSLQQPIH